MGEKQNLDANLLPQFLALLPVQHASVLLALSAEENVTAAQWETAVQQALESIEQETRQEAVGALFSRLLPLETLVPDGYQEWRPLVREAVAFLGARLSPRRLAPKLVAQFLLPSNFPLEQRVMLLIVQMPSLQKLGQIIARNRHLAPALRAQLTRLENAIHDLPPAAGQVEIQRQLGHQLRIYSVELEQGYLAEGSVSVVVRFRWVNPTTGQRERGVFKVLKPYVREYFTQELDLLQDLADLVDAQYRGSSALEQVNIREVFDDVRHLLEQEINFLQEQANLAAAAQRYINVAGVRVPLLLADLCTPTITAMKEEQAVQVTQAFINTPWKRYAVARHLIEALLAVPLYAAEEDAVFHADPHAGNLFYDETSGEVVVFDWALTERLGRADRRQLVLLVLAVALRDEQSIYSAIAALSLDDFTRDQTKAAIARSKVRDFLKRVSPFSPSGLVHAIELLDTIALAGVRFSPALVIFRKVFFTLEGVLHDIAPGVRMDAMVAWALFTYGTAAAYQRFTMPPSKTNCGSPLLPGDWLIVYSKALMLGSRLCLQTAERLRDMTSLCSVFGA